MLIIHSSYHRNHCKIHSLPSSCTVLRKVEAGPARSFQSWHCRSRAAVSRYPTATFVLWRDSVRCIPGRCGCPICGLWQTCGHLARGECRRAIWVHRLLLARVHVNTPSTRYATVLTYTRRQICTLRSKVRDDDTCTIRYWLACSPTNRSPDGAVKSREAYCVRCLNGWRLQRGGNNSIAHGCMWKFRSQCIIRLNSKRDIEVSYRY